MALPTFLQAFLGDNPELAFFGSIPQSGNTAFQDYFRGQFGDIFNRFRGGLGREALSGRIPTTRFSGEDSFLENFDFLREFQSLSPSARGEFPSRFAPRVRFNA